MSFFTAFFIVLALFGLAYFIEWVIARAADPSNKEF